MRNEIHSATFASIFKRKKMNTTLWIMQGILALMMLMPGIMKLTSTKEALKEKAKGAMDWVDDVSSNNIKLIGVVELLIAIGVIIPLLITALPNWLTPLAAVGAVCTMLGAMALHIKRKDGPKAIGPNILIMAIALFVAYGRFMF